MLDFTLPNSAGVLPVDAPHIPVPAQFQVELGQITGAGAPPPQKNPLAQPWLTEEFPALGQATADNAPPPQPK